MDRQQISRLAHADHPIAAPLDDASVRGLLARAVPRGDARVLDLGCGGGGEWLLRALTEHPRLTAEGVDVSEVPLAHARAAADRLGVTDRLVLHHEDAARFTAPHRFDLVLCVGATHAFGGLPAALAAAREHLAPGGRVLVGDGFWDGEPSAEAVGMLGDLTDLATTLDRVVADGWTPGRRAHQHPPGTRRLRVVLDRVAGLLGPGPPRPPRQRAGARGGHRPP